jgi:hypothetical protein
VALQQMSLFVLFVWIYLHMGEAKRGELTAATGASASSCVYLKVCAKLCRWIASSTWVNSRAQCREFHIYTHTHTDTHADTHIQPQHIPLS